MASLSNINGLFDVHSTGAILFSTSHGASGQILRSNGDSAPTWIPQSDIVGDYLPLAGGTLTGATATATGISFTVGGALTGTTAAFSGSVTGTVARFDTLNNNANSANIIYRSGTDTIVGNNANALVVEDGGNVGIGTVSPAVKLHIKDPSQNGSITDTIPTWWGQVIERSYTSASNAALGLIGGTTAAGAGGFLYLGFSDDVGANSIGINNNPAPGTMVFEVNNSTRMVIQPAGNVGIGTDSPSALLEIQTAGTSGLKDFQIFSRGESPNYEVFKISRSAGSTELLANQNLTLSADYDANHTSVDSNIIFKTDNTEKMRIDSSGLIKFSKTATTATAVASINHASNDFLYINGGTAGASFGDDNQSTRMICYNNDYIRFDCAAVERMRLTPDGNNTFLIIKAKPATYNSKSFITLYGTNSSTYGGSVIARSSISSETDGSAYGANLKFYTNDSSNVEQTRMTIDSTGNVGIGTTGPFSKLQVGSNTFTGGNGMHNDARVGMSNHGILTGLMLASTYNDAAHPEYGLVFVQGPSTSSYNVWSISPDGPAKGSSLIFNYQAQSTNIHSPANAKVCFQGSTGNVGIGTNSPDTKLDVSGTIKNYATQSASTWLQGNGGGLNYGMDIFLTNDLGSTQGATRLRSAYGGIGTAGMPNFSISRSTTNQAYNSNPNTLTYSESLVINGSSGNVGIGTTSPNMKFNVGATGGSSTSWSDRSGITNSTTDRSIFMGMYSGNAVLAVHNAGLNSWNDLYINTVNGTTGMVVKGNGNVGIGVTGPTYKLQVAGTTLISGGLKVIGPGSYNTFQSGNDYTLGLNDSNSVSQWWLKAYTTGDFALHENAVGDQFTIQAGGNVGIGTTTPYERLSVNGVLAIRAAYNDPNMTVSSTGMSLANSGSLEINQSFVGTSSNGDTIVFKYEATSWKSWQFEYCISAAYGFTKGGCGGYNNQGMSPYYYVTTNQGSNVNVTSVVAINGGASNQHVIVTITGNFGIHPVIKMKYTQGGGDGAPRADRASLTFNS